MILWITVKGLIVWLLCVLFMLAIFKGGHRTRGQGYEQKLYSRSEVKKTTRTKRNPYLPVSAHK